MRRLLVLAVTAAVGLGSLSAFAVAPGSPGDATCDGVVDSADGLQLMRVLAGLASPPPCSASAATSDANGDGTTTLADVLVIRRSAAGLPVTPRLLSISPGKLAAGSPATDVVIFGGFLTGGTVLRWGATNVPLTLVDDGSIAVASLSASNLAPIASIPVTLLSPGESAPSSQLLYELVAPQGCSPANGVGGSLSVIKAGVESASVTLSAPQNMTGWKLISIRGNQQYTFPVGYVYDPSQGAVRVWSNSPAFPGSQSDLWWRTSSVWANEDDDDGRLVDCQGTEVAYWDDPKVPLSHP